ncbi:nitroreductase family protein [Mesorhizobium sp. BR1-1-16]|uniref:nitroreductase family protein n=1 Tax=Mesorhizobium sp. BR1-1-16 TaxID=2876653 RepID=UPI001CCCF403|nr:nitroreductase family protein [Mesorhizobium sp. BR1-1-16]MBZ9935678.1 nitroreductase family protein [Mesorhizobium sp. BR1-1-16]
MPPRKANRLTDIVPRIRRQASLLRNFAYDYRRFTRASYLNGPSSRENRKAQIHLLAHMIEHGLSLRDPRPAFGMPKVAELCADTARYIDDFGLDASTEIAVKALVAYAAFNKATGGDIGTLGGTIAGLERRVEAARAEIFGGTEDVLADEVRQRASMDFLGFMDARHSVRQYADQPVAPQVIERAVRAAQQTPSSCNRQTCRAYVFTAKDDIARVLDFQEGHRGFGEQLGGLAIVTSNLSHWYAVGERYQGWIDGGMFAMTLALGLHAEGLGACMLNWSTTQDVDRAMRDFVGIPDDELVITMIGFGHMPESFKVPRSQRKPVGDVLHLSPPLPR